MLTETQLAAARPIVRAVARGYYYVGDVDDLTQAALLHLWERRERFAGGDTGAIHWAARSARNLYIDMLRCATWEAKALKTIADTPRQYHRGVATPEETCYAHEAHRLMTAELAKRADTYPVARLHRAREAVRAAVA